MGKTLSWPISASGGGMKLEFAMDSLELTPDLFSDRWPRGTDKQKMK